MEYFAGVDFGSSCVRIVVLDQSCRMLWKGEQSHNGDAKSGLNILLNRSPMWLRQEKIRVLLTGVVAEQGELQEAGFQMAGDIPAIQKGAELFYPQAGCVIEIGAQNARFLTELNSHKPPMFSVNEGCAGGTGSFFEDQMHRLGMELADYSDMVGEAKSIPRLSGRCSVFAKTDIIHRQQEGVATADILLGLCYAAVKNYKAVIVKNLPVIKPLALCGGGVRNAGVVRAVSDLFELKDGELLTDENSVYVQAAGAGVLAMEKGKACAPLSELFAWANGGIAGDALQTVPRLPALKTDGNTFQQDPVCEPLPAFNGAPITCSLGIDVGSTSTNLVLTDQDGRLLDFQYLRTRGNPQEVVARGMEAIRERFGEQIRISTIGVTGSGRYLIGKQVGAGLVVDEITAQGKAASCVCPEVDTVFEIGGQDSKYIQLNHGKICDFQMNKICAAGTGSFLEEQAGRMQIPLHRYGELALAAGHPVDLGERCTVFIESSINSCLSRGVAEGDILAGLCYSVIYNYLHKVVGNKPVGEHVILQGGVCYNPAVVAAFQSVYGNRVQVSPYFSVSGAYGAAVLALEEHSEKPETDQENRSFYQKSKEYFLDGYTRDMEKGKPVIGIPYVLLVHKFFPLFRHFFEGLGYQVLLSPDTDEEIIALAQSYTQAETCYPVKLIYGHMAWLTKRKPDYLFLPSILTMKHETSKVCHNYGCVYMQTAPKLVFDSMRLKEQGIRLLNPVFSLDFGQQAMAQEMIRIGCSLGHTPELCKQALVRGSQAVREHGKRVEALGRELLSGIRPDEKVLVMITRTYGIEDPVLNMGIPEELLKRGYHVITLSHLPGHDLDISEEYENLYWPFGQHIISGAKLVASHPNLYAVYLTNHGCGPDTMLSHLFRKEMGDKPYLSIEVDEHFSKVGVITRIEAFLNSLKQQETKEVLQPSVYFSNLRKRTIEIRKTPLRTEKLYLPYLEPYSESLAEQLKKRGYDAESLPPTDADCLTAGRRVTMTKEYLSFTALAGQLLKIRPETAGKCQFWIPQTEGSEADGVYPRVLYEYLSHGTIVAPTLETMPWEMEPKLFEGFFAGILAGDLRNREREMEKNRGTDKRILLTGDPWIVYDPYLNGQIEVQIAGKGMGSVRMPFSEYLVCLWKQRAETAQERQKVKVCEARIRDAAQSCGTDSPFADHLDQLLETARQRIPVLTGANAAYRAGKVLCSEKFSGILNLSSMYENVQTIMDLSIQDVPVPTLSLRYEGSNLGMVKERVESFLYYI